MYLLISLRKYHIKVRLFQNFSFGTASSSTDLFSIEYSASTCKLLRYLGDLFIASFGAFFAPQKTGLSGSSGRKSAMRIYFWSFAYGKTPHWIQAWSLRSAQTPEAKLQSSFATAPLQSLAHEPASPAAMRVDDQSP
jgi:hypothetical protein